MITVEYEDEKFILEKKTYMNVLTKKEVKTYTIKPKGDFFHMQMKVLGSKIVANFPEGLSFCGKNVELWMTALIDADNFIKKATPFISCE